MGSLSGGHYTSTCRNPDDREWYHFNDGQVSPARMEEANTAAAYVLFYRRRA